MTKRQSKFDFDEEYDLFRLENDIFNDNYKPDTLLPKKKAKFAKCVATLYESVMQSVEMDSPREITCFGYSNSKIFLKNIQGTVVSIESAIKEDGQEKRVYWPDLSDFYNCNVLCNKTAAPFRKYTRQSLWTRFRVHVTKKEWNDAFEGLKKYPTDGIVSILDVFNSDPKTSEKVKIAEIDDRNMTKWSLSRMAVSTGIKPRVNSSYLAEITFPDFMKIYGSVLYSQQCQHAYEVYKKEGKTPLDMIKQQ